jgi:large subunit ribosomal protein L21
MFVVFEINGRQYEAYLGDEMSVDLLSEPQKQMTIDKILLFKGAEDDIHIGQPYVADASLSAEFLNERKDKKLKVFFYRRRKDSKKMQGHRQRYSVIRLTGLTLKGKTYVPVKKEKPAKAEDAVKAAAQDAAAKPAVGAKAGKAK